LETTISKPDQKLQPEERVDTNPEKSHSDTFDVTKLTVFPGQAKFAV
jgi:hypothetical protein